MTEARTGLLRENLQGSIGIGIANGKAGVGLWCYFRTDQGQAMGLEIIVKGACMWLHIHFESVTGLLDGCRG